MTVHTFIVGVINAMVTIAVWESVKKLLKALHL
jgi:hypothetical protein